MSIIQPDGKLGEEILSFGNLTSLRSMRIRKEMVTFHCTLPNCVCECKCLINICSSIYFCSIFVESLNYLYCSSFCLVHLNLKYILNLKKMYNLFYAFFYLTIKKISFRTKSHILNRNHWKKKWQKAETQQFTPFSGQSQRKQSNYAPSETLLINCMITFIC